MRGRKPKPSHLKSLTGNPGKRALNRHEPKPQGDLVEAPDWMTESQKAGWNCAVEAAPLGLLKQLDAGMLAIWVIAEDLHREAARKIAEFGLLTKGSKADVVQTPYLRILNKQAAIMVKAASELGFSPASRSRISVGDNGNEADDTFGEFLKRANER